MRIARIDWVDPDGRTWEVTQLLAYQSHDGFGMLEPALEGVTIPEVDGELLLGVTAGSRSVAIDGVLHAASVTELGEKRKQLADAFNPYRRDPRRRRDVRRGKLLVTEGTGVTCELRYVMYQGGCEFNTAQRLGPAGLPLVVRFKALDPWWWKATQNTFSVGLDTEGGITVPLEFPLVVEPEGLHATATLVGGGNIESWPDFEVRGPGTDPVMENTTTGERMEVQVDLQEGDTLLVSTRPLKRSITLATGGTTKNLLSKRKAGSKWPSIQPGDNGFTFRLTNALGGSFSVGWNDGRNGL